MRNERYVGSYDCLRLVCLLMRIMTGFLPHTGCLTSEKDQTSRPLGNDRSPESQPNVWRHHNLRFSEAGNSELETVTRN